LGKIFKALSKAADDVAELQACPAPSLPSPAPAHVSSEPESHSDAPAPPGLWNDMLVAAHGAASGIAESLRILRTRILHPNDALPPKVILVTSTVPREGKTFLAANLGITIAQGLDKHVLIIDADFRRPSVWKLFGIPNSKGLVDYLRDGIDLAQVLLRANDKLTLLPSGPPPINPAELLTSGKMAAILEEVAKRYDDRLVIVDSPPILMASETEVLARLADGVILVVRQKEAKRELIKKTVAALGKEKIIGVVFNAVDRPDATRRYQDHYGYYDYSSTQ